MRSQKTRATPAAVLLELLKEGNHGIRIEPCVIHNLRAYHVCFPFVVTRVFGKHAVCPNRDAHLRQRSCPSSNARAHHAAQDRQWHRCPRLVRRLACGVAFFFNGEATTEIYTLSLLDALSIIG